MKILVTAYACEPGKGSEPEVGWQWVHQIARFHETWVITRANNRLLIEEGLKKEPNKNLHFVYIDLPAWASFWKKGNRGVHLYYQIWQILSGLQGRKLHREIAFDIVQHVTFVNDWIGSGASLVPVSFVWGPIGSHPFVSIKYKDFIGSREYITGLARLLLRLSARYRDPLYRRCVSKSERILVANRECIKRLPAAARNKALIWAQNSASLNDLAIPKKHDLPLNVISVGRLVGFKGFRLAIKAFASHLQLYPESRLTILGDGKQRHELEQLACALGIERSITFAGQVARSAVLSAMNSGKVFLFPSFEGAGMVVIEAMAKGLPVVCLDFGGPGEYVTENCGIKVPLSEPVEVIKGLSNALSKLASNKELYERLSVGAIERVKENYLWDRVGDKLNSIYQEIFKATKDKAHSK